MRRVGLHHVDIVVSSLERSLPLYRQLLEPLGYTEAYEAVGERGEAIWYLDGEGVGASLGIREAQSAGEHDRYALGLHHLAFEASSKELVDERYRWARDRGLAIENEATLAGDVTAILEKLQARAIVVGHTVTSNNRIATRFDGRVVQIDTGMLGESFFPGGRASALEIQDGRFVAIYEDGREQLPVRLITSAAPADVAPAAR